MPLITFPADITPSQINWTLERFDTRYDGLAGTFQTATIPGGRWRCTLIFPPMKPDNARPLQAFLARVSDIGNRFLLPDFSAALRGAGGGTPLVDGAGQTGKSIITKGWPADTLILRAGDMVQFGPNRLHIVTADVTSNPSGGLLDEVGDPILDETGPGVAITTEGSGNATILFEPALRTSPAHDTPITVGLNAKAAFMLDSGYAAASTPGVFTGISIEVVQDLRWSA